MKQRLTTQPVFAPYKGHRAGVVRIRSLGERLANSVTPSFLVAGGAAATCYAYASGRTPGFNVTDIFIFALVIPSMTGFVVLGGMRKDTADRPWPALTKAPVRHALFLTAACALATFYGATEPHWLAARAALH